MVLLKAPHPGKTGLGYNKRENNLSKFEAKGVRALLYPKTVQLYQRLYGFILP